ncbi:MAG: hypothetical protein LUE27_08460 [Clostridia bacterium]|nr:hypothetical protein [Clostridia bacterium]
MTKAEMLRQAVETVYDAPLSPFELSELIKTARNNEEKEIYTAIYNCIMGQIQRELVKKGVY